MYLTILADVVRRSGLPVVEVAGWRTRGRGHLRGVKAVIAHHTATSNAAKGDYPSLGVVRDGHGVLAGGPLSQLGLGRSGTVYVIAAGLCWHAGSTVIPYTGNEWSIGIEAEHDGRSPWSPVQYDAYVRLVASLTDFYQAPVYGHKEINKADGKIDPTFGMEPFRRAVRATEKTLREDTLTMADIDRIMGRLDSLQAAVQVMANALAGKADRTNRILDPLNPDGIQAAVQTMANALAQQRLEDREVLDQTNLMTYGIDWKTQRLVEIFIPDDGPLARGDGVPALAAEVDASTAAAHGGPVE